jgi:hypothetical protein
VQLLTLLVMLNSVLKSWQAGRCTCSWFSMIVYVTCTHMYTAVKGTVFERRKKLASAKIQNGEFAMKKKTWQK